MRLGFLTSSWIRGRSPLGFVLALCWMLLFGLCTPAQAKRIALVIGNDAYEHVSKLQKAGNDATAMAAANVLLPSAMSLSPLLAEG